MVSPDYLLDGDDFKLIWDLDAEFTEPYEEVISTEEKPNKWKLQYFTTGLYDEVKWRLDDTIIGDTNPFYIEISSTNTLDCLVYREGVSRVITFVLGSRQTAFKSPILRYNSDSYEILSPGKIKQINAIKDLIVEYNGDIKGLYFEIKLKRLNNKFISFLDGDYLLINGLKFIFTTYEENDNGFDIILLTNDPVVDFTNLVNRINLIQDPRLHHDKITYIITNDLLKISGNTDPSLFTYYVDCIQRVSANRTWSLFNIQPISGKVDICNIKKEIGYGSSPVDLVWHEASSIPINDSAWIGIRITRLSSLDSTWFWLRKLTLSISSTAPTIDVPISTLQLGDSVYIKGSGEYKIYKISGITIGVQNNVPGSRELQIKFRFSEDRGRHWSMWMPFNLAVLKAVKWNPLRFHIFEWHVQHIGPQPGPIYLQDLSIQGSIQTVNCKDALDAGASKTCIDPCDQFCDPCYNPQKEELDNSTPVGTTGDNLRNPYAKLDNLFKIYQNKSEMINQMWGWDVEYVKTDPDQKGQDHILHEYQLTNIVDIKKIKITVPENQFPDRKFTLNSFTMDYLDIFTVHITRGEFMKAFGNTSRPDSGDFLYFPQINRLFDIGRSSPFYGPLNASTYYEVQLVKHKQRASQRAVNEELQSIIDNLEDKTLLDNLTGAQVEREITGIASPKQLLPLSRKWAQEYIHQGVENMQDVLLSNAVAFSKYQYNMVKVPKNEVGIRYRQRDWGLSPGQTRTWIIWINFNSIYKADIFRSPVWTLGINGRSFYFMYRDRKYEIGIDTFPLKTWCAFVVSVDNLSGIVSLSVWGSSPYEEIKRWAYKTFEGEEPIYWDPSGNFTKGDETYCEDHITENSPPIELLGGDFSLTNIRILDQLVQEKYLPWVLQQYHVSGELGEHVIITDNAAGIIQNPTWMDNTASF